MCVLPQSKAECIFAEAADLFIMLQVAPKSTGPKSHSVVCKDYYSS
eukprot:UN19014